MSSAIMKMNVKIKLECHLWCFPNCGPVCLVMTPEEAKEDATCIAEQGWAESRGWA